MVNSPVFYAAMMTMWLVALPGFLNISYVPGTFMSLVMTAAPSYIFVFCGSHYNSSLGLVKSRLHNVKSHNQYAYWKVWS